MARPKRYPYEAFVDGEVHVASFASLSELERFRSALHMYAYRNGLDLRTQRDRSADSPARVIVQAKPKGEGGFDQRFGDALVGEGGGLVAYGKLCRCGKQPLDAEGRCPACDGVPCPRCGLAYDATDLCGYCYWDSETEAKPDEVDAELHAELLALYGEAALKIKFIDLPKEPAS